MRGIELTGEYRYQLRANAPSEMPAGPALFILPVPDELRPEEDEAGNLWARAIAREWSTDLSHPQQDIYTLDDGSPVSEARRVS